MNKRLLAQWLRSGFFAHGTLSPTTAGVPPGGLISPVLSNLVLEGLEHVLCGPARFRRRHHLHSVRWADAFLVTATSPRVLAESVLPRIAAFVADRGVGLSTEKTVLPPRAQGVDFLGQTVRKHERPNRQSAKLRITPSRASLPARTDTVRTLCKQARGATPEQLIDTLTPVLRGGAHSPRHSICGQTFAQLATFVWPRV